MKFICYLFFFSFVGVRVQSQSLSIDETIDYLNKFSKDQPYSFHVPNGNECDYSGYFQFSIDKEGILTVNAISSKFNCKGNEEGYTDTKSFGKFYIQDLNTDKISILYNGVLLMCKFDDPCITQTFLPNNKETTRKTNAIEIITSDRYNTNKLYNALAYLLTLALEKGYVRNDVGDPFANRVEKETSKSETKKNPTTNPTIKSKTTTEIRISLNKEGGVFSLNLTISGLITKFILDSGAGECNISSETEKKLIANGIISQKDYLSNGLYRMADGSIVENRRVKIPKMVIGKKAVYNVIASVGPSGSPNLLGQSFLKKLDQWSIDNSKEVLIIK